MVEIDIVIKIKDTILQLKQNEAEQLYLKLKEIFEQDKLKQKPIEIWYNNGTSVKDTFPYKNL